MSRSTALNSKASTSTIGILSVGFFLALSSSTLKNSASICKISMDIDGVTYISIFLFFETLALLCNPVMRLEMTVRSGLALLLKGF